MSDKPACITYGFVPIAAWPETNFKKKKSLSFCVEATSRTMASDKRCVTDANVKKLCHKLSLF